MSNLDPNEPGRRKKGRPVLIVLIAGLALALVAFVGMGIFGASQPDENIGSPEDAGISTESVAPPAPAANGTTTVSPSSTPAAPAN